MTSRRSNYHMHLSISVALALTTKSLIGQFTSHLLVICQSWLKKTRKYWSKGIYHISFATDGYMPFYLSFDLIDIYFLEASRISMRIEECILIDRRHILIWNWMSPHLSRYVLGFFIFPSLLWDEALRQIKNKLGKYINKSDSKEGMFACTKVCIEVDV